MTLRVGINGFGRIGKCIFKILRDRGIEVPLVNDPFLDLEYMHYLLKYDSTYGKEDVCQLENDKIIYKGKPTSHSTAKLPSEIPWKDFKVDYVIESTGLFLTLKDCEGHKDVKSIIITAPSPDAPMFVFGVNHLKYNKEKIISNASCTTNCLAPLANILNKNFGIEEGLMMTVHSVTATQKIVDGITKKNKRDGRSGMQNIIPASTGAAKAVTKVLPELEGKLNGMALRVPTPNVSIVDLSVRLSKPTSLKEISEIFEKESKENKEIIGITYDEVVSTDFNKDSRSCILDARGSMELNPKFFKLLAWYDNEYGYSCRTVDLLEYVSKQ
jgi:glyceraldehyde 3-phosphate dehydrogenase